MQVGFSAIIFVLLSSEDGFALKFHTDESGVSRAPAIYNGGFSTVSFLLGGTTSILSGWLGMRIATYANARTALEARKGIAPAFMCGKFPCLCLRVCCMEMLHTGLSRSAALDF